METARNGWPKIRARPGSFTHSLRLIVIEDHDPTLDVLESRRAPNVPFCGAEVRRVVALVPRFTTS